MKTIKISYVITTYNKINSLKIILNDLINKINYEIEELIIIDGGSVDGTDSYLKKLQLDKKISKLIIEKDYGEAHGFNKGILLAEGTYIKIMTDDDVYNLNLVRNSISFMEENNNIDILFSNGFTLSMMSQIPQLEKHNYETCFETWKNSKQPFSFCGLGLMLRKSSLPLIGLFNNCFVRVDADYSFRNSKNGANLALLTTPSWIRIANELSNSNKYKARVIEEEIIFNRIYLNSFSIKYKLRLFLSNIYHIIFKKQNVLLKYYLIKNILNCFFVMFR